MIFKCKFREKCDGYRDISHTCTLALNKCYCGIYRMFRKGEIKEYRKLTP